MSLPLRPRSSRVLLPLLLVAVALAGYYGWTTSAPAPETRFSPLAAAVAGGALLLALLAYVVVRGLSRRRARSVADPVEFEESPLGTEQPVDAVHEEDTDPDIEGATGPDLVAVEGQSMPDRGTQLHIKTLETALEEQSARIAELERESTGGHDLERVLLTVGALRQRVHGHPESESVLNRVEAAILRLNASCAPARPTLPVHVPGSRIALVPAPTAAVAAAPAVAAEPAPVAATPVVPQPAAPATTEGPDEPVAEKHVPGPPPPRQAAPIDEPVLPVPPPPVQVAARGSRWRRRGAA